VVSPPSPSTMSWKVSHRIIRTIYPPVDLFEDVVDPSLWDLLVSAEAKLNPRVRDQVGDLSLVPVHRRVSGPSASLVMGAFIHASKDRPSRFSDGSFGVWYCGDRWEVALAETIYHFERFMRLTNEPAGEADYRELTCTIGGDLHDIRGADAYSACCDPLSWSAGQTLGKAIHAAGGDGIVYKSVRWPAGFAAALFWPDRIKLPVVQARQIRYHWDGHRVSKYFIHGPPRVWTPWP
jgi:hypothetical protein